MKVRRDTYLEELKSRMHNESGCTTAWRDIAALEYSCVKMFG